MTRQDAVNKAIARSLSKDMEFFVFRDWDLLPADESESYRVISEAGYEEAYGVDIKEEDVVCMVYAGEVCEVYD